MRYYSEDRGCVTEIAAWATILSLVFSVYTFFYNSKEGATQQLNETKKESASSKTIKTYDDTSAMLHAVSPIKKAPAVSYKKKHDSFLITFVKTPVVYLSVTIAVVGSFIVGIIEGVINLFTNFNFEFEYTEAIWKWGWRSVAYEWYWQKGTWWCLLIAIALWFFVASIFGRE